VDFSFILAFAVAIVVATMFQFLERRSAKSPRRATPFAIALAICLIFSRPWEALYPREWKEGIVIVFLLVVWVAFGTLLGSAIGKRLARS
jgi:hypothetical protein